MTARLPAFLVAAFAIASPSLAQVSRMQPTTQGPSALEAHAARMEHDAVEDLKAGQPGTGWFVDLDVVYPTDLAEYQAIGKYAVMVFSLFSNDRSELPLAKVVVGDTVLQCLESIPRDMPPTSASAKAFGKFRAGSLCTIPVAVARGGKDIRIDFAKNHKGVPITGPVFQEPEFVKADSDPWSPPKANPAVLQLFINREYPGFGFHVGEETSHLVYDKPPASYDPVTLENYEKTLESQSVDVLNNYPQGADRITHSDVAYPVDSREYAAFGNRGVMVVTAVTHRSDELPLKRVYMRIKGNETDLVPLARVRRPVTNPTILKAFGEFREDSVYLVPASAMADPEAQFLCDFAKNRSGFVFSSSPYTPPDFIGPYPDPRLGSPPSREAVNTFLKREYPGFFEGAVP